jgi:hypothetical protein
MAITSKRSKKFEINGEGRYLQRRFAGLKFEADGVIQKICVPAKENN